MSTVSEADERAPRVAVWGFVFSLVDCVLWLICVAGLFCLAGLSDAVALVLLLLVAPLSCVPSVPGLLLSLWGLVVARKRHAPQALAVAGVVLGIVGTVLTAICIADVIVPLLTQGMFPNDP